MGSKVWGLGLRVVVWNFGFVGLGCWVWGLGFEVWGLGFKFGVWGLNLGFGAEG